MVQGPLKPNGTLSGSFTNSQKARSPRSFSEGTPSTTVNANLSSPPSLDNPILILTRVLPDIKLTDIQTALFIQAWQGKTYKEIAICTGYASDYLKDVGHKLWKILSQSLGEPISKNNFCSVLKRKDHERQHQGCDSKSYQPPSSNQDQNATLTSVRAKLDEAPQHLVCHGRSEELSLLRTWLLAQNSTLIGIFGLAGIGKTALAAKCAELFHQSFDALIWRSLRNGPDFNRFIDSLLQTLDTNVSPLLPSTPEEKVSLLIRHLSERRGLVIIDDWSTVLRRNSLAGSYQDHHHYYGLLLRRLRESRHQSTIMIISREKPGGAAFHDHPGTPVHLLRLQDLKREDSHTALRSFGLSDSFLDADQLVQAYGGNPYALQIATKTVRDLFDGDISAFLRQGNLIYGNIRNLLEQQFARLTHDEKIIMYNMASLPEPITIETLRQSISQADCRNNLLENLESLYNRGVLTRQNAQFKLSQILKHYLISQKKHTRNNSLSHSPRVPPGTSPLKGQAG